MGLVILAPIAAVLIYRFVDPPVTIFMMLTADRKIEREWVPLARISPNLIDAVIASEDANFCLHHGFDVAAIREAWRNNERSGQHGRHLRGGSTISMQTAKNVFLWSGRTWLRKGLEAYFTMLMETLWPKRRIIELYLNVVEWGDSLYGAEAASQRYFGLAASRLTEGDAARLAAVLPNPEHWSPRDDSASMAERMHRIEEQAEIVRVDGKARCVVSPLQR